MNSQTITTVAIRPSAVQQILAVQDNYTHHVRDFAHWLADNGQDFSEAGLRSYFTHLNQSDYAASTKRIKRQAVKKRVKQLAAGEDHETYERIKTVLERLDQDFATSAPKVQQAGVGQDKVLDPSEYRRLVHGASRRLACFVNFLWATGCRISEVTMIKHGSIVEKGDDIVKIRVLGKGNKERVVRISRALYDYIGATFRGELYLFETQGAKPYSRCYVTAQLAKLGKRAIGRHVHAHMFRHSFASRKVQALPGKLEAVSKYLGHSSVSITLNMYCHSTLSDSELLDTELEV